jgi:predicted ATPase
MWYEAFHFKNFKGIHDMTLTLSGDVTTLIGLNESGKTTILEAIFCFSYGAEDLQVINPTLASLRDPEQWIPISKRANFNDTIQIGAIVGLDQSDQAEFKKMMRKEHGLSLKKVPEALTITENYLFKDSRLASTKRTWNLEISGTRGQQRTPRAYGGNSNEWKGAVKILKSRLPRIWYFPNFLFELPDRFILTENENHDDEAKDRDRFYKGTFEQIIASLGSNTNLQTHVIDRLDSSDRIDQRNLKSLLLDMGRKITTTIFEGWDRIFGRAPTAQEVELDAGTDETSSAYLELKIKGPDGYYDLSERSLGFRWFFMFLLMTSFHDDTNSSQKPLFLLDEPASNLHSTAQAELLKSFENLTERCHLIYTTHSHHMINLRWLDSALVVTNAALGNLNFTDYVTTRMGSRTSISAMRYRQFVATHPNQTSYFQPVLDLLDYRPSVLEPVPDVVLVEGKSDFYLLRYMIDVIGVEGTLHTAPGGGAGSLDALIRLYIGWGKGFLVLLDNDAEGRKQKARYEADFGPVIQNRLVFLSEASNDNGIIEAEYLLSDSDKQHVLDAIYQPGATRPNAKKALRNAIIELFARREAVPVETATKSRFAGLIADLTQRLASLSAATDSA